jgi:hypothetical protein
MKSFILLFLSSSLLIGCSKTTYWTTGTTLILESPTTMEIQITDSTFTTFRSNSIGCLIDNSGNADVRKSRFNGDTIFVYDVWLKPLANDTSKRVYQEYISEAYLQKGRKLYPITWFDQAKRPVYYFSFDTIPPALDLSKNQSFKVNWNGNYEDTAYLFFNQEYHYRGKLEELRTEILNKREGIDSMIWYYRLPKVIINDTMIEYPETSNYWGPLKPF